MSLYSVVVVLFVCFFFFLAIKIEKISADNKDAIVFSLNETVRSTKEYFSSISLPPRIFKGQGRVSWFI